MALEQSFTAIQVFSTPIVLRLADTSTGTDGAVVSRRVYLQKADGSYLVPEGTLTDYIEWDYSASTIDISVLYNDVSLNLKVQWLDGSGNELYKYEFLKNFVYYSKSYYYALSLLQALNNDYLTDRNYFEYKSAFKVNIDDADNAIDTGADIMSAQNALNRATSFVTNKQLYF